MKKQIYFSPSFSKEGVERLNEGLSKSQKANKKIIEELTELEVQEKTKPFENLEIGDMIRYDNWKSRLLPEFPEVKMGLPSSLEFTDEELHNTITKEIGVFYTIFVFHFDNGPESEEGEADGYDGYAFYGFEREEVAKCAEKIVEFWKLDIYERRI